MSPEEIAERLVKIAQHNEAVHRHNAKIDRKIERLKQAIKELTSLQVELESLRTNKLEHGGENVWKGDVYREHKRKVGHMEDDVKRLSSLIGDTFEDYSNKIRRLRAEKQSYWFF